MGELAPKYGRYVIYDARDRVTTLNNTRRGTGQRKIALYGAKLHESCIFGDPDLGSGDSPDLDRKDLRPAGIYRQRDPDLFGIGVIYWDLDLDPIGVPRRWNIYLQTSLPGRYLGGFPRVAPESSRLYY